MNPQQNPVPRLDLAPKLKRPLSLRNPLDYLRLLYWVFYFPQAIRWYVETFGNQKKEDSDFTLEYQTLWQKAWVCLREYPIESQLCLQGLFLTLFTPVFLCGFLELIGIWINWLAVALSVIFPITLGLVFLMVLSWKFVMEESDWKYEVADILVLSVFVLGWTVLPYSVALSVLQSLAFGVGHGLGMGLVGNSVIAIVLTWKIIEGMRAGQSGVVPFSTSLYWLRIEGEGVGTINQMSIGIIWGTLLGLQRIFLEAIALGVTLNVLLNVIDGRMVKISIVWIGDIGTGGGIYDGELYIIRIFFFHAGLGRICRRRCGRRYGHKDTGKCSDWQFVLAA